MSDESIKASLSKLKQSIESSEGVDEETLALAQNLEVDIQKFLDTEQGVSAPNSSLDTAIALETKFEAEHPTAAGIVREIISALHKLGI